jgi:amino acid adenylation domain-containing protein
MNDLHERTIIDRYWLSRLSGNLPGIRLPLLPGRKEAEGLERGQLQQEIPPFISARLQEICRDSDLALFIFFLSGLYIAVHKYTGVDDLVIGIIPPKKEGVKDKIVLCRNRISGGLTLKETVERVKQNVLKDFNYADYSFGAIYQKLLTRSSLDTLDVFNIAFIYDKCQNKSKMLNQFDLVVVLSAVEDRLIIQAEYNSGLYTGEMIQAFCRNLIHIFDNIREKLDEAVSEIGIAGPDEVQRFSGFNNRETAYPQDKTIQTLFEEQVDRTPDNTALVFEDKQCTYRKLNERANRLARMLRAGEVRPGTIVAIMLERSADMVIALLAVLKAGGLYLPIDPAAPENRVLAMLKDSEAPVLLTRSDIVQKFSFNALKSRTMTPIEPKVTPSRRRITSMDDLPLADRSLVDYKKYHRCLGYAGVKNSISLETTRGCPYHCIYCHKIFPKKQVSRSAGNIFAEVWYYYNLGVRRFTIIDDIFNLNVKNSSEFFKLIIKNRLKLQLFFSAGLRGDILTRDYIDLMIEAGTVGLAPALETASPRLQRLIKKNLHIEKLRDNIEYICKKHPGVILELFIMHGFPTETEEEARLTMDFVKSIKWLHFPYINILRIYANTQMEALAVRQGISREAIVRSEDLAWHQLPETLPFKRSFTVQYQTDFLYEYFLLTERLLQVLPHQMKLLTEDELVQKYNSYLPVDINSFGDLLQFMKIGKNEVAGSSFLEEDYSAIPDFNGKVREYSSRIEPAEGALKILLLDLNLFFSGEKAMLYDLVDEPLGLIRLMTYLNRQFGSKIEGKIAKSRIDFNSYGELKTLLHEFRPDVIGVRTVTFYRAFFQKTVALIRQWGIDVPIVAGGPHATGNYKTVLRDRNVDLVVLGEGELAFSELIEKCIGNGGRLPVEEVLEGIAGLAYFPAKQTLINDFDRQIMMLDAVDKVLSKEAGDNPVNINQPPDPAYIIYTSGSMGKPKGVMVEHRNVVAYLTAFLREFDLSAQDVVIQQASFTFDAFVEEVYPILSRGGKLVLPRKNEILDIHLLAGLIDKNNVTVIDCSPLLLNELNKVKLTGSVRTLISGGDVLKEAYVDHFLKVGKLSVYNTYGPTETTVCVTYYRCSAPEQTNIFIGKPISNYKVFILDKSNKLVPLGVAGELCVAGVGLARGYLNAGDLTGDKFVDNPFGKGRLYRTGDLVRWLPDGNLEFLGRLDHQVQVRGFRIEPGEIEARLRNHPEIEAALVIDRQDKTGEKYLCSYIVSEKTITTSELRDHLARHLPDYMLPAHFVRLEKIPRTPGGKIDRNALPEPSLDSGVLPYISEKMLENFEVALFSHQPVNVISLSDTADKIGLNMQKEMTVLQQYAALDGKEYFPLSHPQKRIYYAEKTYPDTGCENLAFTMKYRGELDEGFLQEAVNHVLMKYEELRLRIVEIEQGHSIEPAQYISAHREYRLDCLDFSSQTNGAALAEWIDNTTWQPFHLIDHDLFYFAFVKFNDKESGLYIKLHHIISDVWTFNLLFSDIDRVYEKLQAGKAVEDSPAPSYRQYIFAERAYLTSPQAKNDVKFWQETIFPLPAEAALSFRQGDSANIKSGVSRLLVPDDVRTGLKEYIKNNNTSLYKLLLSALAIYIARVTALDDFIVGGVNHNRANDIIYKEMAGIFVSIFPIRLKIEAAVRFRDFVEKVGKDLNHIVKNHQRFPFDILAAELREKTGIDPGFLLNIFLIGHPDLPEEKYKIEHRFQGYEPNPLTIHINFSNKDIYGQLELEWDYQLELFTDSDVVRIHRNLMNILVDVLRHPDKKLSEIEPLSPEEKGNIQARMNESRVNLGEIENCLLEHGDIGKAAVVLRKEAGRNPYLCAFIESEKDLIEAELLSYLSPKLPQQAIPARYIRLEKTPYMLNGRVNRKLLEMIGLDTGVDTGYNGPRDEVENKLAEIWSEVLTIDKSKISIATNFFEVGGQSLKATILLAKIHKELQVKVPMAEVFKRPTIKGLGAYIKESKEEKFIPIKAAGEKKYYVLSSAQKRMYFLQQMDPGNVNYNMLRVIPLDPEIERERLEETFRKLIDRHESLRTSFALVDDQPVQKIHDKAGFWIDYYDLSPGGGSGTGSYRAVGTTRDAVREIIKDFVKPFDLSKAPFLRVGLINTGESRNVLIVDMHHIISDGLSLDLMEKDLLALYYERDLPELRLQYKDYSEWQAGVEQKRVLQNQEEYWLRRYAGQLPVLHLPTDFKRPIMQSFAGNRLTFEIDREVTKSLKELAKYRDVTMFMLLFTFFNILLTRLSGQSDVVVGTPVAGRRHADLENIIGMFVNTLAIKSEMSTEQTFGELLKNLKQNILKAFENQDYPFEDLVEKISTTRDTSRNPIFDVAFSFQDQDGVPVPDQLRSFYYNENLTSKFDMTLAGAEADGKLLFAVEYCTKLFKADTIKRFVGYFKDIIQAVRQREDIRLKDIKISHELADSRSSVVQGIDEAFSFGEK